jgi:UPF0271 protein
MAAAAGPRQHGRMTRTIDLNADLGEVPGDLALMAVVSSANVACGGHAGDASTMADAAAAAEEHGVHVGAHPSYVDREGFGRRDRDDPAGVVAAQVADQVALLCGLTTVRYVKLHGALYHRANRDAATAAALLAALEPLPVRHVLAQPGALLDLARERGWGWTVEGFCDRAYREDGSLVDRREPGAVLEEPQEVVGQAVRLAVGGRFGSLCLHGDTPGALRLAREVRAALEREGVEIRPFA